MMTSALTFLIKLIGCAAGVAMWCTVGLAVWLVKLVRVSVAYSVKTMLQAFKEQDMGPIEHSIQLATNFWPQGFRRILKIFDPSTADRIEIQITWSNLLPGLIQDILYGVFLVLTSYLVFWAASTSPRQLFSAIWDNSPLQPRVAASSAENAPRATGRVQDVAPPTAPPPQASPTTTQLSASPAAPPQTAQLTATWLEKLRSMGVQPGSGVAGVTIGQPMAKVLALLGSPTEIVPARKVDGVDIGRRLFYQSGGVILDVTLDQQGEVERLQLVDRGFGRDSRLPTFNGISFGGSEQVLQQNWGSASRQMVKSPNCAAAVQDDQAIRLGYTGIAFYVCKKNNGLIAVAVPR